MLVQGIAQKWIIIAIPLHRQSSTSLSSKRQHFPTPQHKIKSLNFGQYFYCQLYIRLHLLLIGSAVLT